MTFAISVIILLAGTVIRFLPLAFVDFRLPFRMGGLFVEFAQQIAAHGFLLPAQIPYYTEGGIPFAYPPLPFYVEAVFLQIFPQSEFLIANLLPPIVATLGLFSFLQLIRALNLPPLAGTIALAAFAAMPCAFYDQIESAGLAEAFGNLALIWMSIALARAYQRDRLGSYALAGVCLALSILASPASAFGAPLLFSLFAIFRLFSAKSDRWGVLRRLAAAGIIGMLGASPFLLVVLRNHGIDLFWNALFAQYERSSNDDPFPAWLAPLFKFTASGAPFPFLWDFIIFSGLFWAVLRRQWWLLAWFLVLHAIPREGWWMASTPASLLAGYGVSEVWRPLIASTGVDLSGQFRRIFLACLIVLVSFYALVNAYVMITQKLLEHYDRQNWVRTLEAAQWVQANTPLDSRFVVVAGSQEKEWTPHLMKRTVLNVILGAEWEPAEYQKISEFEDDMQDCDNILCIRQELAKITDDPSTVYLYIKKGGIQGLSTPKHLQQIGYEVLWENRTTMIGRFSGAPQP